MSAIIIAAILLVVIVSSGMLGFFTRFDILDSELKEHSASLVDACVDTAMAALAADSTYSGGGAATTVEPGGTCQVIGSVTTGNNRTFKIQGIYRNSYTNALVTLDTNTASIVSWQEISSF